MSRHRHPSASTLPNAVWHGVMPKKWTRPVEDTVFLNNWFSEKPKGDELNIKWKQFSYIRKKLFVFNCSWNIIENKKIFRARMGVWCHWSHSPALLGKRLCTVILDWYYSFTVRINNTTQSRKILGRAHSLRVLRGQKAVYCQCFPSLCTSLDSVLSREEVTHNTHFPLSSVFSVSTTSH